MMMANSRSDAGCRIKAAVSCGDLLERNGYHPDRHGLMLCPFHSERSPSFRVYPGGKGWYCFGCHKGGDVISLAQELYQTNFRGAVQEIDRLYNLGLTGEDTRTEAEKRADAVAARRHRDGDERERLQERWGVLNAKVFGLQERMMAGEDIDPMDVAELISKRDRIGWMLGGDTY